MFSLCVYAACCQCVRALWGGRFDPVTVRVSALCRGSSLFSLRVYAASCQCVLCGGRFDPVTVSV